MSYFRRTVGRLDGVLDTLDSEAIQVGVGTHRDRLRQARKLVDSVRQEMLASDHDDERKRTAK